jgi:hypothetical protein
MAVRKVAFAAQGNRPPIPPLPRYAMADETETDIMAVRRVIEHMSGYAVAVCEHKGSAKDDQGRVTSANYNLTLGTPMRSGGYSVAGQLHVAIWNPVR